MKEFMDQLINNMDTSGDVFIVPNQIITLNDMFELYKDKYIDICHKNGINNPYNEKFVQVWIVTPYSENLDDHGQSIRLSEDLYFNMNTMMTYVPISLLEGKDDGESVSINIPFRVTKYIGWESYKELGDIYINYNLTLQQRKYRYGYYSFKKYLDILLNK